MTGRATRPLLAMIVGGSLAWTGVAIADDQAAHAMAEKFAVGAEQEEAKKKAAEAKRKAEQAKRKADEERQRAADEAEMLRQARAEAADRKAAADKARAEEEALEAREEAERVAAEQRKIQAAEQRKIQAAEQREIEAAEQRRLEEAAEQRRIAEAEEQRKVEEERRVADEKRIAEQKRADEERRLAEQQRVAAEQREIQAAEQRKIEAAEQRRLTEEKAEAERQKALVAAREAEHQRLTERLIRLKEKREERKRLAERPAMGLGAPQAHQPAIPPQSVSSPPDTTLPTTRVTVLLVMESGTNGIRRYGKKTADPVICSGATCWVSMGNDHSATAMHRGTALGPGNTLGRRAAACNQHLACVFRDIDLKTLSASIQPIDLRIMRHDRREPLSLEADTSCRLSASGGLSCDRTFSTRSWRAWVVPESVAKQATPAALEAALDTRLSLKPSAALQTGP
jgi:chemotaxis protein histidine kinase CheA